MFRHCSSSRVTRSSLDICCKTSEGIRSSLLKIFCRGFSTSWSTNLLNLLLLLSPDFSEAVFSSLGQKGNCQEDVFVHMLEYSYMPTGDGMSVPQQIQILMLKDLEKESIQVTIRVRPLSEKQSGEDNRTCIRPDAGTQRLSLSNGNDTKTFAFDSIIGSQQQQQTIFEKVGLGSTSHCLQGYNCSIFAYGQTGSGKTFTMMGLGQEDQYAFERRGLIPRTLEHLFQCIDKETQESRTQYLVKCTFLQIYNEAIIDLLDKNNANLQIRQDLKKGVYVEGLYEQTISKSEEALELLRRGSKGRHVGSTFYNQTSSRSHSVFTLLLQSRLVKNGVVNLKVRKFHFIDLAGSERTRHSNGERLKQGCSINKSLHVLGMVINSLVEATEGKPKHVNYRDSKLTFLLKDALGGNSKTHLIANISPGLNAYMETLSTLNFARRVKLIKLNKALINEDASGNLQALKSQILRLKQEIIVLKSHPSTILNNKETNGVSPIQHQLQKVFVRSDGHLGMQKMLKDYIEESIQKETKFEVELLKRDQKIDKLQGAIKQYTKNEMHLRMIIDLYERRFQRMKALQAQISKMGEGFQQEALVTFFKEERETLNGEVVQLRELLKETPFLKALIKQNNILKDESKNPEQLAYLLTANMKFLSQLRQELTYSIKEREQLNNVIENYAIQKTTAPEMASPKKQKQLQDQLKNKEEAYDDKVQQLGLQVAYLKSTNEENELLLKQSVQREIIMQEKIRLFEITVQTLSQKAKDAERLELLLSDIQEKTQTIQELQGKIGTITMDLMSLKEQSNSKSTQISQLTSSESNLREEAVKSCEAFTLFQKESQEKLNCIARQLKQALLQSQEVSGLFHQAQSTLQVERANQQRLISTKEKEFNRLIERIDDLEKSGNSHLSQIVSLNQQKEKDASLSVKQTEELNLKIERLNKQLEVEKVENKRREEELEDRVNQKLTSQGEVNQRLRQLSMQLISKEGKLSASREQHSKALESLEEEISKLRSSLETVESSLCAKAKQLEESKTGEQGLQDLLKTTKDQVRRLTEQSANCEEEFTNTIEQLQTALNSIQPKYKASQSTIGSLEEQLSTVTDDVARKQKQLERQRQSHLKEVEMMREEAATFKERVSNHEMSMKQIFDDCLNNKQKIIGELRVLQATQLAEEKKRTQDKTLQAKLHQTKLKQTQESLQSKMVLIEQNARTIESLEDQLNRLRDQSQLHDQERQTQHNEFIDRKNEEIQQLQAGIKDLQAELTEKDSMLVQKEEEVEFIQAVFGEQKPVKQIVQAIKDKIDQLEKVNNDLKTRLAEISVKETSLGEQVQRLQCYTARLQSEKDQFAQLGKFNLEERAQLLDKQSILEGAITNLEKEREDCRIANDQLTRVLLVGDQVRSGLQKACSEQQLRLVTAQNSLSELQIAFDLVQSSENSLKSRMQTVNQEHSSRCLQVQRLQSQLTLINQQFSSTVGQLQDSRCENVVLKEELKQHLSSFEASQVRLFQIQQESQQACKSTESTKMSLQEAQHRLKEQLGELESRLQQSESELAQSLSQTNFLESKLTVVEGQRNDVLQQLRLISNRYQQDIQEKAEMASKNLELINESQVLKSDSGLHAIRIDELNRQVSLLSQSKLDIEASFQKQQQLIICQQEHNRELEGKVVQLQDHIHSSINSHQQLNSQIRRLSDQNDDLKGQLQSEKLALTHNTKMLEDVQSKMLQEKSTNAQRIKNEFLNQSALERNRFTQEILESSRINSQLVEANQALAKSNRCLQESKLGLTDKVKFLETELTKQTGKVFDLKRLIENLERQKQQLEKELDEKEVSYKRLLGKICKDDQPRKQSEDKKAIIRTNELLEKSRLEVLEYKKMAEENTKHVKRLKAEVQAKEEHYLNMQQKAEDYCKSQQSKIKEVMSEYSKLQHQHSLVLSEVGSMKSVNDQNESLREQLSVYRQYKDKNQKRREDLELTIRSMSQELDAARGQLEGRNSVLHRSQDEKLIFINKLKQENNLLKRQKHTMSDEVSRLRRQNQTLLKQLEEESEQRLRLKQLQQRRPLKQSGQRQQGSTDIPLKIELERKVAEIRYLQEGYAQLCAILNIKRLPDTKNRGESTLGLIKNVVQKLNDEVSCLKAELHNRDRQIQSKSTKMEIINREYNHLKAKDYKKPPSTHPQSEHHFNPIRNAIEDTNKIVGEEFNSFQDIRNQAIKLREQSKLRRDRF